MSHMDREESAARPEAILISGRDPKGLVGTCALASLCALIMGAAMSFRRVDLPTQMMLAAGIGLAIFAIMIAVVFYHKRRFLCPVDDGFIYITSQGERKFHDDDVMCVSLYSQEHYFWGNLQTVTRRFIIWVETSAAPERIVCDSNLKPSAADPLQRFVVRIINGLHQAARYTYHKGERVAGDGWALERGQLVLSSGRSTGVYAIEDLAAVDIVDEQINVWRRGQDFPIGRISVRTANAHLLLLMLNELLTERAEEGEANSRNGHLGRVIFERRLGSKSFELTGWLAVAVVALVSLSMIIAAGVDRNARRRVRRAIAGMVFGSLALGGGTFLGLKRRTRFRRHAFGVYQRGLFSERRLRFSEIASFSYIAVRRYSHGIYNGTALAMTFHPAPGLNLKPILFGTQIYNIDAELDRLRDEVSRVIANRMNDYWLRNANCPWLPYLTFRADSLEYCPLTFTGRKPPVLIPLSSIANFSISNNTFHIWQEGQRRPVVSEEITQPNFYPGLTFLSKLINQEVVTETVAEDIQSA